MNTAEIEQTTTESLTNIDELRQFLNPTGLREQDLRQRIYSKGIDELRTLRWRHLAKLDQLEAQSARLECRLLENDFAEIIDRCHAVELVSAGRADDINAELIKRTTDIALNRLWIRRLEQLVDVTTFRLVQLAQL